MHFRTLTDDELVRHAQAQLDPLTSTELERELLQRMETLLSEKEDLAPLIKAAAEYSNSEDLEEILDLLRDHYIDSPAALKQKLERADKFYDIASDAGDVIDRLNSLINTTL